MFVFTIIYLQNDPVFYLIVTNFSRKNGQASLKMTKSFQDVRAKRESVNKLILEFKASGWCLIYLREFTVTSRIIQLDSPVIPEKETLKLL